MFKYLVGVGLIFGLLATADPAAASNCASRDLVVQRLQSKYDESLAVGGLQRSAGSESVMEVWASDETGTFTVLVTTPAGISCIVAVGTDFFQSQQMDSGPKGSES